MMASSTLRRRFASGVLWNALGTVALQGGTFLTNLAVANLVGAAQYGQFGFLVGTAQTLASVLQLSTGIAATKYVAQHRRDRPELAAAVLGFCQRLSLTAGLGGSSLLAAFAALGAGGLAPFDALHWQLGVAAPIVFCSVMMGFQMGALAGLEGFANSARALVPLMVFQLASTSAAAHAFALDGALWAMSGNFALRTLVCWWLLRREARAAGLFAPRAEGACLRRIFLAFMLPGALTGLTTLPAMWVASAALAGQDSGYAQLGHFNAAFAVRGALMIVPWIAGSVGFSLLNAHLGPGQQRAYGRILRMNIALSVGAALAGAVLVALLSDPILRAYGHDFIAATPVLQLLMLSLVAEALALPVYQSLASQGRMWISFFLVQLPRDALIAITSVVFAASHGAMALAAAHTAGWLTSLLGIGALMLVLRPTQRSS